MIKEIAIATDFTLYPGPRYERDGPFSGELFRKEYLMPALEAAKESGGTVRVILDGVAGYGSSFLEEAFGGLVRSGVLHNELSMRLDIVGTGRFAHHAVRARQYIEDAFSRPALVN